MTTNQPDDIEARLADAEAALAESPDDGGLHLDLAEALLDLAGIVGEDETADPRIADAALVRAAIHSAWAVGADPDDERARMAHVAALGSLHMHDEELAQIEWLAESRPDDPELAMVKAHALDHVGREDEALAEAERAAGLAPADDVMARIQPALHLARMGRRGQALSALDDLLNELDDPDGRALVLGIVADLLETVGRHDEALARLSDASDLAPGEGYDWSRGALLVELGRTEEALAAFARELEADPDDPRTLEDMAAALTAIGREAEAVPVLERAAALDPDLAGVLAAARGRVMAAEGDARGAVALLRDAVEGNPVDADARLALADALDAAGDAESAAWERRQAERIASIE